MMDIMKPFEQGVYGMLHARWTVRLETPMIIRGKPDAAVKQQNPKMKKGRGMHREFAWLESDKVLAGDPKKTGWSHLTDFNYSFEVHDSDVIPEYSIPASSIRGTLRNWSIESFVELPDRNCFSPKNKEAWTPDELLKLMDRSVEILGDAKNGWQHILSLFGCAFDAGDHFENPLAWAGRLRLTAKIQTPDKTRLDHFNVEIQKKDGPQTMNRHIQVRNPLDRVTQAAKDGALHFVLEMSKGESFVLNFEIMNPVQTDIDLIHSWRDAIDDGFLRFGGLTSQGRGRVKISNEDYTLYFRKHGDWMNCLNKPEAILETDMFFGIWSGVRLSAEELNQITFSEKRLRASHASDQG